jgi:RNA polymerase sigma-70 factor (ECF subfamily)
MVDLATASDATLVVAIARWQESALAEAYRRHGGAVHGLAGRLLSSPSGADDVTQEVFLDLWRRPEQYDADRGSLRTFLLTKAHGKAVDIIRSESARSAREERSARETAAAGYDLDRYAWDLAVAEQVRGAIDGLPADERKAVEMAYFEGRTYRETRGPTSARVACGSRRSSRSHSVPSSSKRWRSGAFCWGSCCSISRCGGRSPSWRCSSGCGTCNR